MNEEVIEIYDFDFDPDKGVINIEAEVDETVLTYPATQYEPEEYGAGRCVTSILWDDPECPSKDELLEYLNDRCQETSWLLVPVDNSEDLIDAQPVGFRSITNYYM